MGCVGDEYHIYHVHRHHCYRLTHISNLQGHDSDPKNKVGSSTSLWGKDRSTLMCMGTGDTSITMYRYERNAKMMATYHSYPV